MCQLCNSNWHYSFGKGRKPASVLFVFGRQPTNTNSMSSIEKFTVTLNKFLEYDWYSTFAIKCCGKGKIKLEHSEKCRKWLLAEFNKVNPFLIVLMGKTSLATMLGSEYLKLKPNVFYVKNGKRFFVGESIFGDEDKIENNLRTLINYIHEYYG